jgi:hypothetical protein
MPRIAAAQAPYPETIEACLAGDERLFERFSSGSLPDRGHLTLRLREIVIDRTTARCGSECEWGVHVAFFAERAGLQEEHLRPIVHGKSNDPVWNPDERLPKPSQCAFTYFAEGAVVAAGNGAKPSASSNEGSVFFAM